MCKMAAGQSAESAMASEGEMEEAESDFEKGESNMCDETCVTGSA